MSTLNMSCSRQLPGCTSYQVWADLIELLIKYDFLSKLPKSYHEPTVMPPIFLALTVHRIPNSSLVSLIKLPTKTIVLTILQLSQQTLMNL